MSESNQLAPSPEFDAPISKKNWLPIAIGIAVVFIAAVAFFMLRDTTPKDPKEAVMLAFNVTGEQMAKNAQGLEKKFPAMKLLNTPTQEKSNQSNMKLTLKNLTMPAGADTTASQILANSTLNLTLKNSLKSHSNSYEAVFNMMGQDFFNGRLFTSPELMSIESNMLPYSLAINPKTLAQDLFNHPMNDGSMTLEQAQIIAENFTGGTPSFISELHNIDQKKLKQDLAAILKESMANATFTLTEKGVYTVSIPPADVKAAADKYYRYIYMESDMSPAFSAIFEPILIQEGKTMEEFVTEITDMIPPIGIEATITTGKKLAINKIEGVASVANVVTSSQTLCNFSVTLEGADVGMTLNIPTDEQGVSMDFSMGQKSDDTSCKIFVLMATKSETAADVNMNFYVEYGKTDEFNSKLDLTYTENEIAQIMLNLDAPGIILSEGDKITYSYPEIKFDATVYGDTLSLTFGLEGTHEPFTEEIVAPADYKMVLGMSEEELYNLLTSIPMFA